MNKLTKILIEMKIYLQRSVSYITIINAGMILFLTLSKLKEAEILEIDIGNYFVPIFILSLLTALGIGYIEVNIIKGFSQENKRTLENNPVFMDHVRKVEEIYNEIHK